MLEYLRLAWDNLRAHKMRSFLTTLGILIGVTTIIIIFTVIESMNRYITGQFSELGAATIYVSKFPWVITGDFFEYRNRPNITLKEYKALDRYCTYTRWISPLAGYSRTVTRGRDRLEQVPISGLNERYPFIGNIPLQSGRWFTAHEVRAARPVCVIGYDVWQKLFHGGEALGRRIKIHGFPYRVIGILEKQGSFFGFNQDQQVMVPYTALRGFGYRWRGITIALKVDNVENLEALKDEVRGILRRVRKVPPGKKDNFAINEMDMLTEIYQKATGGLFLVVLVIGGISLVVGGIGIMNIMLVSVTERTREIGIRKAVGATRGRILMQFLAEAAMISSMGGLLGVIIGVLGAMPIVKAMSMETTVSAWTVMLGFGFSAIVGILSGLYPAHRAAKLNPIDALRYE